MEYFDRNDEVCGTRRQNISESYLVTCILHYLKLNSVHITKLSACQSESYMDDVQHKI